MSDVETFITSPTFNVSLAVKVELLHQVFSSLRFSRCLLIINIIVSFIPVEVYRDQLIFICDLKHID